MSDVHDIWLYPLQDWWRTVNEMSDVHGSLNKWVVHSFKKQAQTLLANIIVHIHPSAGCCLVQNLIIASRWMHADEHFTKPHSVHVSLTLHAPEHMKLNTSFCFSTARAISVLF